MTQGTLDDLLFGARPEDRHDPGGKENDRVMRRFQRRQQRRLNRWLADPDCPEWG